MKHYTISIPDNKANIFYEFMKSITFINHIEELDEIPEHKTVVRERIEKYKNNSDAYLNWEDLEKDINLD